MPAASELTPAFVLLSFEGPDAYSRAGGLGARVSGLASGLAGEGYETHLFYIGAPDLPGHEPDCDGKLHLHRWCQWISRYHAGGVYDGEEGKLADWNASLPLWLENHLLPRLVQSHRPVVVIAEECTRAGASCSSAGARVRTAGVRACVSTGTRTTASVSTACRGAR